MHENFISVRSSAPEYPPKTCGRHSYSSYTRWIAGLRWVAHLGEAASRTIQKRTGVAHNRRWDSKRVSILGPLLCFHCWRDTVVLGLYLQGDLAVKVLLGEGKALGLSGFEPCCLLFALCRDRNVKRHSGDMFCNRNVAPNVTRPCSHHGTYKCWEPICWE